MKMSIIRRIAFSSLLPLREATLAPKVYVMSSAMSVRWKGHSQYMNKKGAIKAAGMRRDKMKTLYSIRIFQAVQVFSLVSGVTLLLIKCIVDAMSNGSHSLIFFVVSFFVSFLKINSSLFSVSLP